MRICGYCGKPTDEGAWCSTCKTTVLDDFVRYLVAAMESERRGETPRTLADEWMEQRKDGAN